MWAWFSCRNWWDWKQKTWSTRKKPNCKFIRINTSKGYDEIDRIQTIISKFKNRQLRKLEKESNKEIKDLEDKIKKNKTSIDKSNHSIKSKCLKWIVKNTLLNYTNEWWKNEETKPKYLN